MEYSPQAEERGSRLDVVLLEDERLMRRIDAFAFFEYDRERPLDSCSKCGGIAPGYRYCRSCRERMTRKRGIDSGFWIQEVAGEGHYQDVFERIVAAAPREESGAAHLWVTAVLVPDSSNPSDGPTVRVMVITDGLPEQVGSIPEQDAPGVQRACYRVSRAHNRLIACRGLINGGFVLEDGTTATYGISLLLPPVLRLLRASTEALAKERHLDRSGDRNGEQPQQSYVSRAG